MRPDLILLEQIEAGKSPLDRRELIAGDVAALDPARRFDASLHLSPGGALNVLSPAHPWLYMLLGEKVVYLDAFGWLASAGNRLLLHSSMSSAAQIRTWDSAGVKSLPGVWRNG